MVERRKGEQQRISSTHRGTLTAMGRARHVPLASHDDTEIEQVQMAWEEKVAIPEFPTTVVAAQAARDACMQIIMGGPNMVKSGSHSDNISAEALAQLALLDTFSSDYVPSSLLLSAFLLNRKLVWSMPRAV